MHWDRIYEIGSATLGRPLIATKSEIALIRRREGKRCCPRCTRSMSYELLPDRVRKWAPFSHGWRCKSCPEVFELDGNIIEEENKHYRNLEKQIRIDLFSAIYKTSFSDKKQPNNYKKVLEEDVNQKEVDDKDAQKRKLEKYIDAVLRETDRIKPLEPVVDAPDEPLSLTPFEE